MSIIRAIFVFFRAFIMSRAAAVVEIVEAVERSDAVLQIPSSEP